MTEFDIPAGDHSADFAAHVSDDAPPPPPPPDSDAGQPAHADDGAPRKKRRRRRRRGRGRGGPNGAPAESQTGAAVLDEEADDAEGPDEGADDEGAETAAPAHAHARPPEDDDSDDVDPARLTPHQLKGHDVFAETAFADLGLRNSVLKGVTEAGFVHATHIQAKLIPAVIAGKDVLGQAKTGSGKTAAFGLPLFHMATRGLPFQSIILCPTRELAIQIAAEMGKLGKFTPIKTAAVYGGQAIFTQTRQLEKGPEIIVATPGRFMDMLERRQLHLNNVKFAVLDEVDRMLDIGFRDDIRRILGGVKTPHQTIFVSATISSEIEQLARKYMREDVEKIVTTSGSLTVSMVEQHYLAVAPWDKRKLLLHLLKHEEPAMTVVFCRTKRTVDDLARYLSDHGVDAHAIHGDLHQGKRNKVMTQLREGTLSVLVASDLASRGLDVEDITHVVNYDLPEDAELYIHRIGRTARAGRKGVAWALVTPEQGPLLTQIEKLANCEIPKMDYPDFTPGPIPDRVRAEQQQRERRMSAPPQASRYAVSAPPASAPRPAPAAPAPSTPGAPSAPPKPAKVAPKVDPVAFPGGVVPTKLPPSMMYGRVKTSRSKKGAAPPPEE